MSAPARAMRWAVTFAFALGLVFVIPAVASADPGDIGFQGPAGAGGAPSGSKPESKLWFNDGAWWGSLWDTTTNDFYIWKLNRATETWSRTSTRLDERSSTRADVLWDGTASKLYVASHNFSENDGNGTARLYRLSYDTGTDTYTIDSGFPKTINSVKSETLVIAKDSTGLLWATWEAGGHIWINHTIAGDTDWGTPIQLPGAAAVNSDDISSIIAFGGNRIGVFWSNQNATPDADYFAIHQDGDADTTWTIETAYTGTNFADDHVNLKTLGGVVYAVVKTSLDNAGSSPLIVLLDRATNGTWSSHTVSESSFNQTRPIVEIDETNNLLRVFDTSGASGGTINQHVSALSPISFPGGTGSVVIKDASALKINNASSTKQNLTASTGLIVLSFNDTTKRYWHADIDLGGGPPPNTPPSASPGSRSTPQDTPVSVGLAGSDPETCQLTFSIVTGPSHGSLGSIGNAACVPGSPNTDSATVTYTPTSGYSGPDSFTYKVNDGTDDSTPATVTLTVTPSGGGGGTTTFIATEDAQVKSTSPTTNYGSLATLQLREEAAPGVTYHDYLKFDVSGLSGTVSSVKLRLFITDVSTDSGTVYGTSTGWSESSIVWNTAPALGSSFGAAGATTTVNTWVEVTLDPSSVANPDVNGNVAFSLKTTSTNSSIFSSSEGTNPPELVVTTQGGGDITPPNRSSTAVNGATLTVGYDEPLDTGSTPATGDYAPKVNGSARGVTNVVVSGSTVTLTLASPVVSTDTVTLSYTAGGSPLQDVAGNDAANFTDAAVTNNTPPADLTPPNRTGQTVNGASLVITYNEALDTASVPLASAFDVQVNGSPRNVSNVGISGQAVTLTLGTAVISTDSVTVAYAAPASNPVQDLAGNDAASYSAVAVTNNTSPPNTPPTANATSATTPFNTPVSVGLSGSDPETCQLSFSIVTSPSHGALGSISNAACVAGSPNTDSATVTYTPTNGYSGPDSFTYKVNDGTDDSPAATASLTVSASSGGTFTYGASDDAQVKSTSPTTNYGSLATMQLREEPAGGTLPTYRDYLKFNISGLSGTVSSVKLRLYITDVSTDSGTVYATDTNWAEGTITWNTAPALGTSFGSAGATTTVGTYIEITLSASAVASPDVNGNVAFAIKTTSTNSSIFDSSEGANPPQLVVTTS